jgi:hypothetical protein
MVVAHPPPQVPVDCVGRKTGDRSETLKSFQRYWVGKEGSYGRGTQRDWLLTWS